MINFNDLSKYRENNRIEAKKLLAAYRKVYGKRILRLRILWAELFYSVWKRMKTKIFVLLKEA